jgi:hypothetical protein
MHCEEKYRLLNVYKAKVSVHSAALNDLALAFGKLSTQEYDRLWALADQARSDAEAASLALFEHTREHGC